jgi:hypothetical protein
MESQKTFSISQLASSASTESSASFYQSHSAKSPGGRSLSTFLLSTAGSRLPHSTLSLATGTVSPDDINVDQVWLDMKSRVLPLYNGDGLKAPVEELNEQLCLLLRSLPPTQLLDQSMDVFNEGAMVLFTKLIQCTQDDVGKVLPMLVEMWSFFFGHVLTSLEGVFLPLQLEFRRLSVSLRSQALTAFRDEVVVVMMSRIQDALLWSKNNNALDQDLFARLQHMLTLLAETKDEKQSYIKGLLQQLKQ